MPVDILNINFLDADFNTITTGVDYLNGSVGDKITAEITFDVHWETRNRDSSSANYNSSVIGVLVVHSGGNTQIIRTDGASGGSFIQDGFNAGDDIILDDGVTQYSVQISGINTNNQNAGNNNQMIVLGTAIPTSVTGDVTIYGITPVTDFDFFYGLPANSTPNPLISLLDPSNPPKYSSLPTDYTNTTPVALTPSTNFNSWVYDLTEQNSTIEGFGTIVDVNKQRFKITHQFYIQPVFRQPDLNANTSPLTLNTPSFFLSGNSLKYTFDIEAKFTSLIPNPFGGNTSLNVTKNTTSGGSAGTINFINDGDVGHFDTVGRAGEARYTLDTIFYKDTLTNLLVTSILPNTDTDITINLNSLDDKFSTTGTKFIVSVYRTPNDATTYENTTSDIKENFLVSRQDLIIQDVPTVTANGFIKAGAVATFTTPDSATINFTFSPTFFLSQDNVLNDLSNFNLDPANVADGYLIFVTCQDKTITSKINSDKVAVLCDVNTAAGVSTEDFYNTEGVCETTMLFNDHPTDDSLLAFTDYNGWLEDSVVTKSTIRVLKNNSQQSIGGNDIDNVWNLNNLTLKIEAEHKTDPSRHFVLEESQVFVAGTDVTATRDFILPIGSPQNEIIWTKTDDTTHFEYYLQYPFKIRWESWKTLFGVDNVFLPNNNWVQYINTDWNVKVNLYKEIDLAQDLQAGAGTCDWTVSLLGKDVWLNINTIANSLPSFTDSLNSITQVGNVMNYSIPNDVERDIVVTVSGCLPNVKSVRFYNSDSKPPPFLDLSGFTNLDVFQFVEQSRTTSILLPNSGGSQIMVYGNSDLFSVDFSGFTNLDGALSSGGILKIRQNPNLDSIILPTVPVAPTFSYIQLDANALTSLDLTPVIQSLNYDAGALNNTPYIQIFDNKLNSADIDQIIIDVNSQPLGDGVLLLQNQTPPAPPTATSAAALANLISNGWTVTTD
jgi:hypothetical protein